MLNNNGYTIERLIHGKEAEYNTLPILDYSTVAHTFGPSHKSSYHGPIDTSDKLNALLHGKELEELCLRVVELKLGYLDAPDFLIKLGAYIDKFNERKEPVGGKVLLDTGRSIKTES